MEPDQLLLQGTKDHQLLAASLLDHYYAPIHRLATSVLQDEAAADDVAQETFITALARLDRYEPGTSMKAWLSTIAINLSRDRLRHRRARLRWRELWSGNYQSATNGHRGMESNQIQDEAGNALWSAVSQLNEKHRLPILLRYANGYTVREIAEALNVPEGTVHSRLHHACRKLSASLGHPDTANLVLELLND